MSLLLALCASKPERFCVYTFNPVWQGQFWHVKANFQAATMCTQLTHGGIYKTFNEPDVESPIFQVLTIKNIQSENRDYFSLTISDGIYYSFHCMVGTQLNWIVENLKPYSKIRVNRYVCKNIRKNRKVLIILDLDVFQTEQEDIGIIGKPTHYETSLQQGVSGNTTSNNSQQIFMETSTMEFHQPDILQIGVENNSFMGNLSQYEISQQGVSGNTTSNNSQQEVSMDLFASNNSQQSPTQPSTQEFDQSGLSTASGSSSFAGRSSETLAGVFPISSLTPQKKTWTIRALVTRKSSLIPYDSNGKKCKRFFIDIADESGEIRAKAFDKQCKKFCNVIKPNKTYYISQSIVQKADKRYNSLKNDYEIVFDSRTMVRLCETIPNTPPCGQFQFVNIDDIEYTEPGKLVDVIAICREIGEISTTRDEVKKRELQIVDSSGEVGLTLWESQAENFTGSQNSVIVVKGAKVTDFRGRTLSVATSSIVQIDPDIEESYKLRRWYEGFDCISQGNSQGNSQRNSQMENFLKYGRCN